MKAVKRRVSWMEHLCELDLYARCELLNWKSLLKFFRDSRVKNMKCKTCSEIFGMSGFLIPRLTRSIFCRFLRMLALKMITLDQVRHDVCLYFYIRPKHNHKNGRRPPDDQLRLISGWSGSRQELFPCLGHRFRKSGLWTLFCLGLYFPISVKAFYLVSSRQLSMDVLI